MYKTKLEALEKCLLIWKTLAETGGRQKIDVYDRFDLDKDNGYCPACQYVNDNDLSCASCIIPWRAHNCITFPSPYKDWAEQLVPDIRVPAQEIVELIKHAIKLQGG